MSLIFSLYQKFKKYFSHNYPAIYGFCDQHKSIIKFAITGTSAGVVDLFLLFLLHGKLKIDLVLATSLAFVISFLLSFSLQKFWTFRNYYTDRILNQLAIYLLNAFLGLSLNAILMHILVNDYLVWYLLAQIMVDLTIGSWNFVIYKFIIFKKDKNEVFS